MGGVFPIMHVIIIIIISAVHATVGRCHGLHNSRHTLQSWATSSHPLTATNFLDAVSPSPFRSSSWSPSFSGTGCPLWCYLAPPGVAHSGDMSCPLSSRALHLSIIPTTFVTLHLLLYTSILYLPLSILHVHVVITCPGLGPWLRLSLGWFSINVELCP